MAFEDVIDRDRTNSDASNEGIGYDMADEGQQDDGYYYSSHELGGRRHAQQVKGTFATISTILTYYPLRDAISILILLLSLPATLVLIIQMLFASLTFVPPTTGISLPSIKEMFNTSSLGYPALATIFIVDLIFYLCWLIVWKPVQSILLDLSQAVIAVSLSGAAASTGGPTYSIVTCSAIVCVVHVLRYRAIHLTAIDYLRSVFLKLDIGVDLSVSFPATSFLSNATSQHGWLYLTLRTLLGVHIVSQGVTTCIRRSLANANEKGSHVPTICRADTEAAAGFDLSGRNSHPATPDPSQSPLPSYNADGRSRASSPGPRDKTRESNTKRRRKQANEVRSKQPLWAAIASTKVTFVKEMEQRDAADDLKEATTMDKQTNSVTTFAMSPKSSTDRVWIDELHDNEVTLCVELSPTTIARHCAKTDGELKVGAGIDTTKPFYIRMNGASWSSVRIQEDPGQHRRFTNEIFGLAPLSSYLCEVLDIIDHKSLCSVNLITKAVRTTEQAPVISVQVQHQPLRPASPVTTLKKSIEQAQANLHETRNRSKRNKKDQKSTHYDIRKEINILKAKLENSGGMDDKQTRRLQQITQHKNQADEAAVQLSRQTQEMGELPQDEVDTSERTRHDWQVASNLRSSAAHVAEGAKSDLDRDIKDLNTEIAGVESKREKLSTRHAQRKEELTAAAARQQADLTARQKHVLERTARREEQERVEAQLRFHIASMTNDSEHWNNKAMDAYQQGQALSNWPTPPPGYSAPATPEGQSSNGNASQQLNGFPSYGPHPFSPAYQQAQPVIAHVPRGRSSSMLSQYSGFTDGGEEPPAFDVRHQYSWPLQKHGYSNAIIDDGKEEGSSSSSGTNGSTGSDSPKPDARLFVPAKMNPIGPPRKKTASPRANELMSPSPPPGTLGIGR